MKTLRIAVPLVLATAMAVLLLLGRYRLDYDMLVLGFPLALGGFAIVMAAITSGIAAAYKWDTPRFHNIANKFGSVCGVFLIIFSIFLSSGAEGTESKLWNQHWSFYLAVAFPCLMGMLLANICARSVKLSPPEVVAVAIECCYQNTGIATSVAITMFTDKEERAQAVAVPLFYGLVSAVGIAIFCVVSWKMGWTKAPPDENICVVMNKSYEITDHAEDTGGDDDVAADADQDIEEGVDDVKKPESAVDAATPRRRMNTAETSLSNISSPSPGSPPSPDNSIPEIDETPDVSSETPDVSSETPYVNSETPYVNSETPDGHSESSSGHKLQ